MKRVSLFLFVFLFSSTLFASPTVFPTGTTIYQPGKCWNGYVILPSAGIKWSSGREGGTVLIDMNGNVLKEWYNIHFFPAKVLPGGAYHGLPDF